MSVKDIVAGPDKHEEDVDPWANLPIKFEPRCKVCKSEFRTVIDRLLVGGNSFVSIAEQFRNKDGHLVGSKDAVRKSVERHSKAHLSVKDAAVRQLLEEKARESGVLVETVRQQLISSEALLELAVAKGTEQLSNSNSKIKYQDAIKAAELLRDKKYDEISKQMEIVMRQQNAINQAIQKVVPKEFYPELVRVAKAIMEGGVGLAEEVVVGPVARPDIIDQEPLELGAGV